MIDSNGHKANKFVVPREIENVPWEKTKSLYINQGIGNKVFFYSSALSG